METDLHGNQWEGDVKPEGRRHSGGSRAERIKSAAIVDDLFPSRKSTSEIWLNPGLEQHEATANLDDQQPATLYYLGLVKNIPQVMEVYVEELERDRRKHWVVLSERDYDAMDELYDLEEDTLNRFPGADLSFRVTVKTDQGPSISSNATKIFDASS